jgi:hypothetical protein
LEDLDGDAVEANDSSYKEFADTEIDPDNWLLPETTKPTALSSFDLGGGDSYAICYNSSSAKWLNADEQIYQIEESEITNNDNSNCDELLVDTLGSEGDIVKFREYLLNDDTGIPDALGVADGYGDPSDPSYPSDWNTVNWTDSVVIDAINWYTEDENNIQDDSADNAGVYVIDIDAGTIGNTSGVTTITLVATPMTFSFFARLQAI